MTCVASWSACVHHAYAVSCASRGMEQQRLTAQQRLAALRTLAKTTSEKACDLDHGSSLKDYPDNSEEALKEVTQPQPFVWCNDGGHSVMAFLQKVSLLPRQDLSNNRRLKLDDEVVLVGSSSVRALLSCLLRSTLSYRHCLATRGSLTRRLPRCSISLSCWRLGRISGAKRQLPWPR